MGAFYLSADEKTIEGREESAWAWLGLRTFFLASGVFAYFVCRLLSLSTSQV